MERLESQAGESATALQKISLEGEKIQTAGSNIELSVRKYQLYLSGLLQQEPLVQRCNGF